LLSPVGDHILQELNSLYLTRFRTYKIARPPKQKPRRGRGLSLSDRKKITPAANFLYKSIFLDNVFCFGVYKLISPCFAPTAL